MNDLEREKNQGLDMEYLKDVLDKKKELGNKYQTPGFGLAAQLFSCVAKLVIQKLGADEGENLLREAIENFGFKRGKHIAQKVKAEGKPLSFKNWLIYTDIDSSNFRPIASVNDGDFIAKIKHCSFYKAAKEWDLEEYAKIYCKYVDR
ncbi:MAG: L-2-amino-thiazoline-4-carboxylic acid hydrolase, partial [Candidatus Hermodarchaeota archaeon]